MTVGRQAYVFAVMMVCGAGMGAAYDVLLALGFALREGRIVRSVLDLSFGFLCAALLIVAALQLYVPAPRAYIFAAAGVGFAVYMCTVGKIVRYLIEIAQKKNEKVKKCPEIVKIMQENPDLERI